MIILGSYDLTSFIKYSVELRDVVDSENSFQTLDGKEHRAFITTKWRVSISAEMQDVTLVTAIFNAIKTAEFSITFTDPTGTEHTGTFRCPNRPFDVYKKLGTAMYWNVSLTFEEV